MRMRKKKNLEPRMAACARWQEPEPAHCRGAWRARFGRGADAELELEIGCGKGIFINTMAEQRPEACFVAIERVQSAMLMALEKAKAAERENLLFIDGDAARLGELFAPGEVDRIYLNFSDPWPHKKQHKRRLTWFSFLEIYREILKEDGEICFKTDNRGLFEDSICYFSQAGWGLYDVTFDLHQTGMPNIETEYEHSFASQGFPIYRCVARRNPPKAPEAPEAAEDEAI